MMAQSNEQMAAVKELTTATLSGRFVILMLMILVLSYECICEDFKRPYSIRIRIRKIKHVINPSRVHTYISTARLPYYHHKLGPGA